MKGLTPHQKKIYGYIQIIRRRTGITPTIREIATAYRVTQNATRSTLVAMEHKGFIRRDGKHRHIEFLKTTNGEAI